MNRPLSQSKQNHLTGTAIDNHLSLPKNRGLSKGPRYVFVAFKEINDQIIVTDLERRRNTV